MEKHLKKRTVVFYGRYFEQFFIQQKQKVKDKILWALELVEDLEIVPENYLKHLEGTCGLYEIRVQQAGDIYRIFCFFDEGRLVVLLHGFQKKTQKTPKCEIEMALKIKEMYYASK
jgi:phage-related protein